MEIGRKEGRKMVITRVTWLPPRIDPIQCGIEWPIGESD